MTIQYLIRDDGVSIVEANQHTLKLPNYRPYEVPKVAVEVKKVAPVAVVKEVDYAPDDAEFDVEWASRAACITYAQENFNEDISGIRSLAKLRERVKELLNVDPSSNYNFAGSEHTS